MFNSNGNSTPFSMPVAPINSAGCGMGGWGDDWIALIVLAMVFGYGGMGFGGMGGMGMFWPFMMMNGGMGFGGFNGGCGGNGSGNLQGEIQRGFDNQSVMNKLNGIEQGICSLGYDNLAQINGVNVNMLNGFHGVDSAICNLGYQTQQGFNTSNIALLQAQNALQAQLAQCCCDNKSGQKDIQYQIATDTCATTTAIAQAARDITENANANYRALHDEIVANRIEDKNATIAAQSQQIFQLQLAASQADQNAYITANQSAQTAELIRRLGADCPQPAYVVQPPQPVTFPTNCCGGVNYAGYGGNGCGCGNGGCC